VTVRRVVGTALLLAAIALSWWAPLDTLARDHLEASLKNALVSFALARTLNGVISVVQGTELAFEPAGVGVVISAGEILDPLNDLVERFSGLVLIAAASLGIQMELTRMFAHPGVNIGLAIVLVIAIAALWSPLQPTQRRFVMLLAGTLVFARFLIVVAALGASLLSQVFLDDRESEAIASLSSTSAAVERERTDRPESSLLDRFNRFLEDPAKAFDLDARIDRLKAQSESAISELINLIVVYALKTVLLPIAVLYLAYAVARAALRSLMQELA
jgi:hypothetical protein